MTHIPALMPLIYSPLIPLSRSVSTFTIMSANQIVIASSLIICMTLQGHDLIRTLLFTDWFWKKHIYKHNHTSDHFEAEVMATETTEVAEPFVNPWHPDAIPPIRPDHPHIVNPTGEFGPDSYIDTGAYYRAKYPNLKSKRKNTKNENGKKRNKPNLKLDFSKIKKGMTQTTLYRWLFKPKTPTRVRFNERVLFKEITTHMMSWTTVALRGSQIRVAPLLSNVYK